ncbi:extensin-like [Girardinichthys multiradiatus]|uniref:extensin-like n=1 Tax=Girardinichthys multiradiatus TaxID=208333 RepID=UPI001FABDF2F|nr:extensin-like [Girardinichthys multiradiatus]
MPPYPRAMNPPPHRGSPPPESSIPKKPTKPHPHSASSTHSPTQSTLLHPAPHHTVCRDAKARSLHIGTPAFAHRHHEHRSHNGTPNVPHHAPYMIVSRAAHRQARPTIWPVPAASARLPMRGKHAPLGNRAGQANHSRPSTTRQTPQCRHKTCSTPHPPDRQPQPGAQPEPRKEALEEGHHSTQRTRQPTNPTPKPRRSPSKPATLTPARHTSLHQEVCLLLPPASQPLILYKFVRTPLGTAG